METKCRGAQWGCIEFKKVLHEHLTAELAPIQERAAVLAAEPERVDALLADGAHRARAVARETMTTVRDRMGLA